ncbi:MAG: hypothetical protein QM626_08230 [Microbacterium sp.]|uniref:hypothetical protein n=1 Tax=Microbacterium sp. TaxID=51671 RepID=UPI0039E5394F
MTVTSERAGGPNVGRRAFTLLGLGGVAAAGASMLAAPAAAEELAGIPTIAGADAARQTAGTADGEVVYLLGYRADRPGVGASMLMWDAAATDDDDGGTVFAVDGTATGRWRRPVTTEIPAAWFGTLPDPDEDQSARIQAAVDALPDGGKILFDAGVYRIENTITVTLAPITFIGAGMGDGRDATSGAELDLGTQLLIKTGDQDAFVLRGARGGGFRDLQMRGDIDADGVPTLTGGAFVRTEYSPDGTLNNYFLSFSACRFKEGYNAIVLQGCNTVRFQNCVWNGFRGEQVILLNGASDELRADPVEFVQCAIAAGTANPGTDNVVIDGLGGSIKFIATAILFGRHGIWMRNTTGSSSLPKFLYFAGGGFENGHGYPILLEAGADAKFSNAYVSADGLLDCVRITSGFVGSAMFSDVIVRGAGRHGFDLDSTRITITGCIIGNNGRAAHPNFAQQITAAVADGDNVRITTASAHGWETGDYVTVVDATGTTLNAKWPITVVADDQIDLVGAELGGYSGGGSVYRHGSGINLRENASRTVITGNAIGGLADGTNRQDYGVVSASTDVLVASNDLAGNLSGPSLLLAQGPQTVFAGNKGALQYDGWFSLHLAGDVSDGAYDLSDILYLDGRRVRVMKVIRRTGAGTAKVRLLVDGEPVGGADSTATTATGASTLQSPFVIDGIDTPRRMQLRVANASDAQDLEVQFAYQTVG